MDKMSPAEVAARVADRVRVQAELAEAAELAQPVKIVLVERKGAAPARAAAAIIVDGIETELRLQVRRVADCARAEAFAASQAEVEARAAQTEELVRQLVQLEKQEAQRAAEAACAAMTAKNEIAHLRAQLESERERSEALSAKTDAMVEARKGASHRSELLTQSLKRAQEKMRLIEEKHKAEARSTASTSSLTWSAADVEAFESCIGELTFEFAELKREVCANEEEYGRN